MLFPLLLFSFLLGNDATSQVPRVLLTPNVDGVTDKELTKASSEESQQLQPALDPSWISMYLPVKSCHRKMRKEYGKFSPPAYLNGFQGNIWCNWTVWAGSKKHIIIYITGFKSDEQCDKNEDRIFFHGISSLAENTVIYACWRKEIHAFATYAKGVHVVFLMRYSSNSRRGFAGRYYIFKQSEIMPYSKNGAGARMFTPQASLLPSANKPKLNKKTLQLKLDDAHSHVSARHRIDQVTELNETLQTRKKVVPALKDFAWQTPDILHIQSDNLTLLSTFLKGSTNSPHSLKSAKLLEMRGPGIKRISTEEITLGLIELVMPFNVYSDRNDLKLSALIKSPSPMEEMEFPSRIINSTLDFFIMNDLWRNSKLAQLDCLAWAESSLTMSTDKMVIKETRNAMTSSQSLEQEGLTSSQRSVLVHETMSREVGLESILLPIPEENYMITKIHENDLFLSLETQERELMGRLCRTVPVFTDAKSASGWEIGVAPILDDEATIPLDATTTVKSFVEAANQLKVTSTVTLPCNNLKGGLHLRSRSSYQEPSRVDISHDLPSKMTHESDKFRSKVKRSCLLDLVTKPKPYLISSKTTAAPLVTELESSHFISLRMASPCPFLPDEQEPPLSHDTAAAALLLAIPGLEDVLLPSMTLTYPVTTIGSDQTLSLAVTFQDSIFSVHEPSLFPKTAPDFSLAVGELGLIPSERMCSYYRTETIEPQTISPTATVLEPNQPQSLVVNTPVASEIISASTLINELSTSIRLQISTVRHGIPSKSSCCQHVRSTSKEEDVYQFTTLSSSFTLPKVTIAYGSQGMDLGYLSPTAVIPPIKESKEDVLSGTTARKIIKSIFSSFIDKTLVSKSELCTLLVRFILNTHSPLNEFVTEMSLIPGPMINNQNKQTVSRTEPAFTSSPSIPILPQHTEEWTSATLPRSLVFLEEGSGQLSEPQRFRGIQQNAKWQQSSLDFLIPDHNVPRPFMETSILRKALNLSTLQVSSNIENKMASKVGPVLNHLDLEFPWLSVYLPVKSCHVILKDEAGTFSPPSLSKTESNNWCNWTIWAGPHKHILIYIEGFEGKSNCEDNQDRIIFQGILSSIENKVTYACRNHGTLIFATQAVAVYVVFLSEASSGNQRHKHFKGRYHIFEDHVNSSSGEKSVLESNSKVEFSPKSYVLHSGHSVNPVETSQTLGKENWLPVTNKKTTKTGLETILKPAVGKYMNVSLLKTTTNVSLNPFDMQTMQVAKPSIDNSRTLNESPTLALESNDLENKEETFTFKPDVFSTSPHMTWNLQMMTKVKAAKNHGAITESVNSQNDGHTTTHWMTTHMRRTEGEIKNVITFPQVSLEEQRTPAKSPKSIPPTMQKQMLLSNSGISKKNVDLMESPQHLELTRIYQGEQMDNQTYRAENGNAAVQITESEGIIASPTKSTMKTKLHQIPTLASTDVHYAPSFRSFNDNLMSTSTTVNPQVTSSDCLKRTQINTAFTIRHKKSVTKYREHLQKKQTKPNPSYFPSGWLPTSSTLLKVKNKSSDRESVFRSHGNNSVLDSQHNPGDLLFEIVFGVEHKGQLPPVGSTLEKAFIDSIKHQVQEKVKLFSNKIKEFKLKEIMRKKETEMDRYDKQNGPNLVFMFWLHLTSEEKNITHLLHFQLEGLGGAFIGAGKVQTVLVRDVNECSSGIGLCGNEAICLNGYGTYFCQCKEEYEDHSLTKSGTLCVRNPRSGLGSLYSYTEIIVGITVFLITVLVVVISVLCTIIKKRCIKKDTLFREAALPGPQLQPATFDHNNIRHLLTLDPAQLKVRAKLPEWPLQLRTSPSESYRVSIEQSECL